MSDRINSLSSIGFHPTVVVFLAALSVVPKELVYQCKGKALAAPGKLGKVLEHLVPADEFAVSVFQERVMHGLVHIDRLERLRGLRARLGSAGRAVGLPLLRHAGRRGKGRRAIGWSCVTQAQD